MAQIKRTELENYLGDSFDHTIQLYLFFGERYLCRKAADELQQALLTDSDGTVYSIDGDREDSSQTLSKLMSFSLLPGLQIYRVHDTRLFHSKNITDSVWDKARKAFESNNPKQAARYLADLYHLASIAPADRQPLSEMSDGQWQQLFGLAKPDQLGWTDTLFELIQENETSSPGAGDIAERYIQNFEKGVPKNNILILSAENVDKRKKLFTYIKKAGLVVDCSVDSGSGAAAQRVQKSVLTEMVQETLNEFGKTIDTGAIEVFFERIGFHPVAVVTETEKLALYCADSKRISLKDIDAIVGRSREDALFELTDHFGKKNLASTLTTLNHLLANGVHGLAILATLRNYIRKLLIFRSLQHQPTPPYHKGMNAKSFQDTYLPELKASDEYKDLLGGHPYALFMGFKTAAEHSCATLKEWLEELLWAEYRLKGSGLPEKAVLENLLITLIKGKPGPPILPALSAERPAQG